MILTRAQKCRYTQREREQREWLRRQEPDAWTQLRTARELFASRARKHLPRAVGYKLSRAFAKLAISSRNQLETTLCRATREAQPA